MNLTAGYICGPGKIEKMPAIRQELRASDGCLSWRAVIQLGCSYRRTSCRGYPKEVRKWRMGQRRSSHPGSRSTAPFGAGQSTWTGPPEASMVLS